MDGPPITRASLKRPHSDSEGPAFDSPSPPSSVPRRSASPSPTSHQKSPAPTSPTLLKGNKSTTEIATKELITSSPADDDSFIDPSTPKSTQRIILSKVVGSGGSFLTFIRSSKQFCRCCREVEDQ